MAKQKVKQVALMVFPIDYRRYKKEAKDREISFSELVRSSLELRLALDYAALGNAAKQKEGTK